MTLTEAQKAEIRRESALRKVPIAKLAYKYRTSAAEIVAALREK